MAFRLSTMSTMWSKEAHARSYFETTLKRAINLGQMVLTIRDTGTGPSLDDVMALLDVRSGLRGAHKDMADEVNKFVKSDVTFTKRPHFYLELLTLVQTTGDSVAEALSMSEDYLGGISDIDGLFQKSVETCSELSLQIHCLTNKARDLSNDEVENLLDMENHSMRTFHRMESRGQKFSNFLW